MSFIKQNASVGLGTPRQAFRRAHVSSSVGIVSDEPRVLHQVWGRWAVSCPEKDLMGQVGDVLQGIHLPFCMERCSANQRACTVGFLPVSVLCNGFEAVAFLKTIV